MFVRLIMRWRHRSPIRRKFKVNLRIQSLQFRLANPCASISSSSASTSSSSSSSTSSSSITSPSQSQPEIVAEDGFRHWLERTASSSLMIKVKWTGSKASESSHGTLRGITLSRKRDKTSMKQINGEEFSWSEDFQQLCVLSMDHDTGFVPFHVHFDVIQPKAKSKSKMSVVGTGVVNLSEFAPISTEGEVVAIQHTAMVQIMPPKGSKQKSPQAATLVVCLSFSEVTSTQDSLYMDRFMPHPLQCLSGPLVCDQQIRDMYDRKLKTSGSGELDTILSNGKVSPRSDSSNGTADVFSSTSLDDSEDDHLPDDEDKNIQRYDHLLMMNQIVEGAISSIGEDGYVEDRSRMSYRRDSCDGNGNGTSTSDPDKSPNTMRSLLSFGRKKSPRNRGKPLLNKAYAENGGDDIDHVRRLSGYPVGPYAAQDGIDGMQSAAIIHCLDFGEEKFKVGCWEKREILSRDGRVKLSTNVFFASIDQRNERADGESACTVLVAVIADWLHKNPDRMPIEVEFDTLIREGSAAWRKLCEDDKYKDRFPDKHFDLETVLEAGICPLAVSADGSFTGFFKPDGDVGDFFQTAKTFDDIWHTVEEGFMSCTDDRFKPAIYIVSWNDHFFVLKMDKEAYYIIDTLGERLYEGCNQAYILRFDKETALSHVPQSVVTTAEANASLDPSAAVSQHQSADDASATSNINTLIQSNDLTLDPNDANPEYEGNIFPEYASKDACKEFIKRFFAALPISELQSDIQRGVQEPLHHRWLQIDFHLTSTY